MRLATAVAAAGLALAACGGASPQSCPVESAPSCASSPPSWSHDVAPLVQAYCARCHSAGGAAANRPLQTYRDVLSRRGPVLNQIFACRMPPASEPQPSDEERQRLVGWLVCRTPPQ